MSFPLLYEINTRCWLCGLSRKSESVVRLDSIPEGEFEEWQRLGFTHIWLMGVWTSGPQARSRALDEPGLKSTYAVALPDWRPEDVAGSPYAIAQYQVPEELGGEAGLAAFRARLHSRGLKLVLDFVPNHAGIDHPWICQQPEFFVHSRTAIPEAFRVQTASGQVWIAHGKDPYFPAWTDTAQWDYRRSGTRESMAASLLEIANRCDGVRCDMAMLILNKVFAKTWSERPGPESAPAEEFWASAIERTKAAFPEFMFLAEAYWGLEPELQSLGFDYTYDKGLYDRLVAGTGAGAEVVQYLNAMPQSVMARSAHFLENHDEPRIAAKLDLEQHRAAALMVLGIPGMRLLHEGQLSGARLRVPVQLARRNDESEQEAIRNMYEQLLGALKKSAGAKGLGTLLKLSSHTGEETGAAVLWQVSPDQLALVLVNYSPKPQSITVPFSELGQSEFQMRDLLESESSPRSLSLAGASGPEFELGPYAAKLFELIRNSGK